MKLYRELQEHWLWEKESFDRRSAWIDLLLMANYKDARVMMDGQLIDVKRGQRITSIRYLCQRWGWSNTKVSAFLRTLEKDGMITCATDKKKTVITIENYSKFQGENDTETSPNRHYSIIEQTLQHTNKKEKKEKKEKTEKKEKKEKNEQERTDAPLSPVPCQKIMELYHQTCPSYARIRTVTDQRKTAMAARWKEHGADLAVFEELFQKAEASPFLKGSNFRKWQANFDWLMKADNMAKVLEGRYDNGKADAKNTAQTIPRHFYA
ncbi:MAG: hypothetical protein SCM88_11455 [Bacillota bacterium]|nr:hypothetical protein [Bacillota bacterium]